MNRILHMYNYETGRTDTYTEERFENRMDHSDYVQAGRQYEVYIAALAEGLYSYEAFRRAIRTQPVDVKGRKGS